MKSIMTHAFILLLSVSLFADSGPRTEGDFSPTDSVLTFDSLTQNERITNQFEEASFDGTMYGDYRNSAFFPDNYPGNGIACNFNGVPPCNPVMTITFNSRITRVGFNALTNLQDDTIITTYRDGVATGSTTFFTNLSSAFIGVGDLEGIDAITIEITTVANNCFCLNNLRLDANPDGDDDGIPNSMDLCPDSDTSDTVVINGCDSGIFNFIDADGCSLADKLAACGDGNPAPWRYMNCMQNTMKAMIQTGELTWNDYKYLYQCAQKWGLPNPVDDRYATDWSSQLCVDAPGVLANDSDPQGNNLEAHLKKGPLVGNLDLNRDGSFCYTPVPGFTGEVRFTYKAWDGYGYRIATVTINVSEGNLAPVTEQDIYRVNAGERLSVGAPGVLANDYDPEGNPLTAHLSSLPDVGHLGFHEDGSFWYDAPADFNGYVTFYYLADDGLQKTATRVKIWID